MWVVLGVASLVLLVVISLLTTPPPVRDSYYIDDRWGDGSIADDWGLDEPFTPEAGRRASRKRSSRRSHSGSGRPA
jgi:hypothetical protein